MNAPKELTQSYRLTPGGSNASGRLPLPRLISEMIDLATRHANMLGFGSEAMEPLGLGWVLSRLTVEMTTWPEADSSYSITTWIESWNRRFSSRCFQISTPEGNTIGYIRTIWMVIDTANHRGATTDPLTAFSPTLISTRPCPIPLQDKHISLETLTHENPHGTLSRSEYTFRYTDIDFYRHVNTVRYIELLLNQYTIAEFDAHPIHRFEIAFSHEALWGQTATIHRLRTCQTPPSDAYVLTIADTSILRARISL